MWASASPLSCLPTHQHQFLLLLLFHLLLFFPQLLLEVKKKKRKRKQSKQVAQHWQRHSSLPTGPWRNADLSAPAPTLSISGPTLAPLIRIDSGGIGVAAAEIMNARRESWGVINEEQG